MIPDLPNFEGLNCTINTTEDCNLRCKYCYEVNKRPKSIDFEKCKKFIDLLTDGDKIDKALRPDETVESQNLILDFIGGDSLIDPILLDKILSYFNYKNNLREVPRNWRCSISSNGTLFSRPEVRAFCEKWKHNLCIGVSIDGCPEIHDANRIFPDGSPSMPEILKNWDWYKRTFPVEALGTKATCSRNSIPYLYDSLKFMHETLGMKYIHQNFIMEDMHITDDDLVLLDEQLEKCCYYVLEHKDDIYWSMLGDTYVPELCDSDMSKSMCGSGRMIALGIDGNYYPCFRWLSHTRGEDEPPMITGNIDEGISHPEVHLMVSEGAKRINCTKDPKCLECEFEPCCRYCIGGCYGEFREFKRTTYICEVTKIICKWAKKHRELLNGK